MADSAIDSTWIPARLSVGLISAGRVGTALGERLERVGHIVSARTERGLSNAAQRLPDTAICSLPEVAQRAELLVIAVPDDQLPGVINELSTDYKGAPLIRPGMIIAHTAGSAGLSVLQPLRHSGAMLLALHPAMTFTGDSSDTDRLEGTVFGITAEDAAAMVVAQALVAEMGGIALPIAEEDRVLYHSALSHSVNGIITLIGDVVDLLHGVVQRGRQSALSLRMDSLGSPAAIDDSFIEGAMSSHSMSSNNAALDNAALDNTQYAGQSDYEPAFDEPAFDEPSPEALISPLVRAALDNVLLQGDDALSGPIVREDYVTVHNHQQAIVQVDPAALPLYRAIVRRTAERRMAAHKIKNQQAYRHFMESFDTEEINRG